MSLHLTAAHLQAMRSHAEQTYPNECCGLLLGKISQNGKQVMDVQIADNGWNPEVAEDLGDRLSLDRTRRFWLAPEIMLAAMRHCRDRDWQIMGIYHSHPDHPAEPSECDRRLAWQHYSYIILSVQAGVVQDVLSWQLDDSQQFQPEAIVLHPSSTPVSAATLKP